MEALVLSATDKKSNDFKISLPLFNFFERSKASLNNSLAFKVSFVNKWYSPKSMILYK